MPERGTNWRQGCVFKEEDAAQLGLTETPAQRVILITHDCDIPNDQEPMLEFIVGVIVENARPEYLSAQHPRTLHLKVANNDGEPRHLELQQSRKGLIPKEVFDSVANEPDINFGLADDDKRILKQWLAARYGRPAFPDTFQNRLTTKVQDKIKRAAAQNAEHLVGLFFDLDADRHNELDEGEPYFLKISVVYNSANGSEAREASEAVANRVEAIFAQHYESPASATDIAFEGCVAVADSYITLADIRRVDQWPLEYISLRDGDNGDFIQIGATPA